MSPATGARPRVLTLNALWPGRGGGLNQDLATLHTLGCEGEALATCIVGVPGATEAVEAPSQSNLLRQLQALLAQGDITGIRLGHLGTAALAASFGELLPRSGATLVVTGAGFKDPLRGLRPDLVAAVRLHLLPHADLLAVNREEVEGLLGVVLDTPEATEQAARSLLDLGTKRLVITTVGGDAAHQQDLWASAEGTWWVTSPRPEILPGIGGVLDSALTAALVLPHYWPLDPLPLARGLANAATRQGHAAQAGRPICGDWPGAPGDLPWLTRTAQAGLHRPDFPDCGPEPLGFYPIVDRADWLVRLLPLGVKTAQLRVKDLQGAALEAELKRGIEVAQAQGCRLFVNDHWELAIRLGAYGVHLGQEDLETADLQAIAQAGLRLGVSTHATFEVTRALAVRPSYIACGPIYPTSAKKMPWAPQGVAGMRHWRALLEQPLVAIAGISLERAPALYAAGADSVAVISAVTQAPDPEGAARAWLALDPPSFRVT